MARSRGEVPTGAAFIRHYIRNHPLYRRDSNISPLLYQALIFQVLKLNNETLVNDCCKCEKKTNSDSDQNEMIQNLKKMLEMEDRDLFLELDQDEGIFDEPVKAEILEEKKYNEPKSD